MEVNWCYAMCDSIILPIVSIVTFIWTAIQAYQLKRLQNAK